MKGANMSNRLLAAAALLAMSGLANADHGHSQTRWQVEITNVTPGQTFTPILAATHYGSVAMFEPGTAATQPLADLAEAGDIAPLQAVLEAAGGAVGDIQTNGALLGPGESVTLTLRGKPGQYLSLAGMLIPTNDTFVGVDSVFLPLNGSRRIHALAYDAGTEANDQNCANIPGPRCGGTAHSTPADSDEGFVAVSNGFHSLENSDDGEVLMPAHYDWNNPVAIVEVRRVYGRR
jgi:hypothetical protein